MPAEVWDDILKILEPEYLYKILTAIGVIATAISSIITFFSSRGNRRKLETMDTRLIEAAIAAGVAAERARVAALNTDIIVAKADEVKQQLAEVREAAVAVNAEVIDKIIKLNGNGKN